MYVIKAVMFANGAECPHAGQYLQAFDHEAYDGQGHGEFTPDLDQAKHFSTMIEAFAFWKRRSVTKPMRSDGEPNRPMTCLTIEIVGVDDERRNGAAVTVAIASGN